MEHTRTWEAEELLQHHRWARSLARHLVLDDATADDVAQESMVIALDRAPRGLRNGPKFSAWLGTVVRNVARQTGRSEARRAHRERESASQEALPSALEMTAFVEGQGLLLRALLTLDEESRHMVLLRYQEGLSAADIARQLGKGGGTVRSKIKRALDRLREELDQVHDGDRSAWHAAVAPLTLAVPVRAAVAGGAAGKGVAVGSRYGFWKYAAGLTVAAAVVVGMVSVLSGGGSFEGRREAPGVLLRPSEGASAEVGSMVASIPGEPDLVDVTSDARERQAASTADEETTVAVPADREAEMGRVGVRFVDAAGQPIAGVQVTHRRGEHVTSGADGRAELAVFLGRESGEVGLRVMHLGHATDVVNARAVRGKTTDGGDHVLRPGGNVAGRVVDGDGSPLAGMVVSTEGLYRRESGGGGITMSTSTQLGQTESVSDSDGRFELRGVLAGEVDVLVESDDEVWTGSAKSIAVHQGETVRSLSIVAEEAPLNTRISGVVLDHNGQPAPYARIRMEWSRFFSSSSKSSGADAEGRFVEILPAGVSVDMWFTGKGDSIPQAFHEGVDTGTVDMEVRLAAPRTLTALVSEDSGQPVANAEVWLSAGSSSTNGVTDATGRVDLLRPIGEFTLVVDVEGYAEVEEDYRGLAPDRSDAMALPVKLKAIPRLEGLVQTAGGEALAGASLSIRSMAKRKTEVMGVPSLVETNVEATGATDEDGRFAVTLRERGKFMLRAEADGCAPAEFGPFRYDPSDGLTGVNVTMSAGGSIEGRVIDGDTIRGKHIVMLARGDGVVKTVRTNLDGHYLFEHVTPGPCLLRVVPEMISSGRGASMTTFGKAYTRIDGDVVVAEGAVSRFDLVIGKGLPPVVLKGQLKLDGFDPARFRASLVAETQHLYSGAEPQPVRVGPGGDFQMLGGKPGLYRVLLVDSKEKDEADALRIAVLVDLAAGTQNWELSAGFGRVVTGANADPATERLLWRGPRGAFAVRPLPAVGESCEFPAGTVYRVKALDLLSIQALADLDRIDPLGSTELAAGEQVTL